MTLVTQRAPAVIQRWTLGLLQPKSMSRWNRSDAFWDTRWLPQSVIILKISIKLWHCALDVRVSQCWDKNASFDTSWCGFETERYKESWMVMEIFRLYEPPYEEELFFSSFFWTSFVLRYRIYSKLKYKEFFSLLNTGNNFWLKQITPKIFRQMWLVNCWPFSHLKWYTLWFRAMFPWSFLIILPSELFCLGKMLA